MLNLRDLHCFVVAYEQRSFSRTADTLDTVQSLISSRIRRLEQLLETPLFQRLHDGVVPTRKGEALYPHAKRIVADVAGLEAAVKLCDAEREPPQPYKVNIARAQIAVLAKALEHYRLDTGRYPGAQVGLKALVERPSGEPRWRGPYVRKMMTLDPWGRSYLYRPLHDGGDFELLSLGRDGMPGGTGEDADIKHA
jgi:general secretion pathway protein G